MAEYQKEYKKLLGFEGGYINDPDDLGEETYKGISRANFPDWKGWVIIDELKENPGFPGVLDRTNMLDEEVQKFYKREFWDRLQLDIIGGIIAGEIFEQAVNLGVRTAAKHLQRALNLLNNNEKYYKNIDVDGQIGNVTLSTLKVCLSIRNEKLIYNVLNFLQGARYIELMEKRETNEKFIGWFNRVEVTK